MQTLEDKIMILYGFDAPLSICEACGTATILDYGNETVTLCKQCSQDDRIPTP